MKLSDPFLSTKPPTRVNGTAERVKTHLNTTVSERSAFKQFAPDASVMIATKTRDDSDYQWE